MASFGNCVDWLRLGRVSAVPTAISNILLGYWLAVQVQEAEFRWAALLLAVLASACLYLAGMVLNDVFDIEQDRRERPERPLPSGRIRISSARNAGMGLLASGVGIAGLGRWWLSPDQPENVFRTALLAIGLVLSILAYDGWLKQTRFAPAFMGLCRCLNLLLGASFVSGQNQPANLAGFHPAVLSLAVALGVYVAGITLVGRKEAVVNAIRAPLWVGCGLIVVGILGFALTNQWFRFSPPREARLSAIFPWLMLMLAFPVVRRAVSAAATGTPQNIQRAVVSGLRSIIVFDAALCFLATPGRPEYALGVLCLLIPSLFLSRWLKPT